MEFIGFIVVQTVICVLFAVVGAACGMTVFRLTRGVRGCRRATLAALAFPLVAVFYLEAGLFSYGLAEYALGMDSFLDGIYHYPLANGYQLVILDKMPYMADIEQRSHPGSDGIGEVRSVQVSGNMLFVTAHQGQDKMD